MYYEIMYILALSTEIIRITNNNPDLAVKFNCIYREAIDNTLVKMKNAKEKIKEFLKFLNDKDSFIHECLSKRALLFERETLEKVRDKVKNYLCDNYPTIFR